MNLTYLGDNIADLRKNVGLSQEELAEKLGVSRQAVSKWERNETYPETENLIALSNLFNLSLDDLVNKPQDNCANLVEINATTNSNVDANVDNEKKEENSNKDFNKNKKNITNKTIGRLWEKLPYPIVITIIYLIWGFLTKNGFAVGWTLYITIPCYYSLVSAIRRKRMSEFAYPVFCTFLFLLFGMLFGIWHPLWIIFLTIPVYYCIIS